MERGCRGRRGRAGTFTGSLTCGIIPSGTQAHRTDTDGAPAGHPKKQQATPLEQGGSPRFQRLQGVSFSRTNKFYHRSGVRYRRAVW